MKEQEFKELNRYLEMIVKSLEYEDQFLLNNLFSIHNLMYDFGIEVDIDCNEYNIQENQLTFNDVFLMGSEIIKNINPKYLKQYNELIKSGILDFSYENSYSSNHYVFFNTKKYGLININRNFNYSDVIVLIHEFIHSLNCNTDDINNNIYLLTEFISIYFELYATKYLIKSGINIEEIDFYFRLRDLRNQRNNLLDYSEMLYIYNNFGSIDSKSIELANEYLFDVDVEYLYDTCKSFLNYFQKQEKDYFRDIKYEKKYDEQEFANNYLNLMFKDNYRYALGSIFAYYSLDNVDMSNIIKLNDNIKGYKEKDIIEILRNIGIDLEDEKIFSKAAQSINNFYNMIGKVKK